MTIGVLLTNTGTPDAPTPQAVRRYLKEFLSDKRIVSLPKPIWLPILYGLILPLRPKMAAKMYDNIWTEAGSPLRAIMQKLPDRLQQTLAAQSETKFVIEIGMNYGNPSIKHALARFHRQKVEKIIVLPLYPQYSNATTASTFDRVDRMLKTWSNPPEITRIEDYAEDDDYIGAISNNILHHWQTTEKSEHLLISFHGLPERNIQKGDPYLTRCQKTAARLAQALNLSEKEWTLCFQSRFGYAKWLKPSTQLLMTELPQQGCKTIDVVCPGFSVDCLETLEEIEIRGKEAFLEAGGEMFRYIPALNDTQSQIQLLTKLILNVTC